MRLAMVWSVVALLAISAWGCGKAMQPEGSSDAAAGSQAAQSDAAEAGESDASETEEVKLNLAKLSAEDAAAAELQQTCPVSDEPLGSMGPPLKVEVGGRDVWICCAGCRDPLTENPEKYLAKLSEK